LFFPHGFQIAVRLEAIVFLFLFFCLVASTCFTGQIAARLGGILAPLSGTLPAAVSCPAFGSACLAAALATVTMPDRLQEKQEAERQRES